MKIGKKYFFSRNQKKILLPQKWNKTHLAVLLGYETNIWHHQSQNLGLSHVLIRAHCVFYHIGQRALNFITPESIQRVQSSLQKFYVKALHLNIVEEHLWRKELGKPKYVVDIT